MGTDTETQDPEPAIRNPRWTIRVIRAIRGRSLLVAILLVYGAAAIVVQAHCADQLTSDGECYLRMAECYVKGDLRHAVFGQWSPLVPWLTTPLVAAGVAPRYAFRVVLALSGAVAIVAVWRLIGKCGMRNAECGTRREIPRWLRPIATGCAALLVLEFSADLRVDLPLAAILLLYLDDALDDRLLVSRLRAFAAGILGALGYLTKLYALPFFLVHFTLTAVVRVWTNGQANGASGLRSQVGDRKSASHDGRWPRAAIAWGMGLLGFAVLAAPWAAALSARFGQFTLGTTGGDALAYARLGEGSVAARLALIVGLQRPPAAAYSVWQDSDRVVPRPTSDPDASGGLARRARWVWGNLGRIAGHAASLDEFRLGLVALGLLPIAVALTWRRQGEAAARYLVVLLAVAVYCGGYALVYAGERRFFWFLLLVALVVAFHFLGLVPRVLGRLAPKLSERRRRLVAAALGVVFVVSFAFHPIRFLADLLGQPPPGREHRLVAEVLRGMGVEAPLAAANRWGADDSQRRAAWWDGLHVAYYLDAKYAGMPAAKDPRGIVAEMRAAGARTLLVWGDPPMAAALSREAGMELLSVIRAGSLTGLARDVAVLRLLP